MGLLAGGGKEEALCEIEVELKSGDAATAEAFARELQDKFALREEPLSKFARGGGPGGGKAMKLLLHICCAPCANRPIASLQEQGHAVTGFWDNPNIHPFTEYRSRRNTVRELPPGDRSAAD